MSAAPDDTVLLLRRCASGDEAAYGVLFERIHADLRRRAHFLRRDPGVTLSTTALVHETFIKLADTPLSLNDQAHFYRIAARAMRRVLIDANRHRGARKRGDGIAAVTLDPRLAAPDQDLDLLALDQALDRLASEAPRLAEVVELHFHAGLGFAEIARLLELSERTVARDWRAARALLLAALANEAPRGHA